MKATLNLVAALVCLSAAFSAAAERPNIVVLLLDNVGQEWFRCYGSEENCTPNIDRLAAGGVRFSHCYTTTVCGPSRVELLTGRYPFRTGWYLHHDAALYSGGGLDPRDAIREAGVAEILPRDIVERLRAVRRAHPVDLDDDEAEVLDGEIFCPALAGLFLSAARLSWGGNQVLGQRMEGRQRDGVVEPIGRQGM